MNMITDDLGYPVYALKRFEGQGLATVNTLTFGRARINLSLTDPSMFDDCW